MISILATLQLDTKEFHKLIALMHRIILYVSMIVPYFVWFMEYQVQVSRYNVTFQCSKEMCMNI